MKGMIQVYTVNGKGKTSAAIGAAIRCAGNGMRVFILQIMKDFPYSEQEILNGLEGKIELLKVGKDDWVFRKEKAPTEEIAKTKRAMKIAYEKMLSCEYDLIILDESLVGVYFGVVSIDELIEFIDSKPEKVELILTGRYAPAEIIEKADLVTEMRDIKHYYQEGITSRKGFDC